MTPWLAALLGGGIGWIVARHGHRESWSSLKITLTAQGIAVAALGACYFVAWLARGAP